MNKLFRTLLLFLSLAAFLLLAPVVIFYALGYRTLSPTTDPVPVGVVLVESQPVNGDVFVNGEYTGRAPEAITEISDPEVHIRVEAEGYEPWEKTIPINPGQATEVRNIRLFPTERVPALLDAEVATFSLSPNRSLVAVASATATVSIHDEEADTVVTSKRLSVRPTAMLWSPENTAVLITGADGSSWLLEVKPDAVPQQILQLTGANDITWHPRFSNQILFITEDSVLTSLDLDSSELGVLVPSVTTYATSQRALYVQRNSGELERRNFQGTLQETIQTPVEFAAEKLLITPRGSVALLSTENVLWVQDSLDNFQHVSSNATRASWSPDGKMLLVLADDNTLSVYNVFDERAVLPQGQLHLVARLSRPINEPQWFSGDRHIIYQVQDEILITEIDTRDHPRTYQADTTNTGDSIPTVGAAGESIFYLKRQGDRLNLMRLPLLIES